MNEADRIRVKHMLEAVQIAQEMLRGETRESLNSDAKLRLALTKTIEIMGEAASRVTPQTRALYPQIPWTAIVGMRNVLIHAYFSIDLDKLWDTATLDLPPLMIALQQLLKTSTAE